MDASVTATHRAIDAVWKIESARLVAGLARVVRDVGLAEDLAQDALVVALERWPQTGVPDNPGAWLMATAKHRAIDLLRRRKVLETKQEQLGREVGAQFAMGAAELAAARAEDLGDELLTLVFTCCHPAVGAEGRIALTLRAVGGLTTPEIARAYLVPEATVAQRIVRAKRVLAAEHVPFDVPARDELEERLGSVLEVVYLIFNEGYAATAGADWMRPGLCEDALRLGRVLAGLLPREPEVHGLVALMEIQASRAAARTAPDGTPILLPDQDRGRWDRLLVRRGLEALARAQELGGPPGPYTLQAAIAACHARASSAGATDWGRIALLYDALSRRAPSPVVELNRAVALGMARGPAAGLALADQLLAVPSLRDSHLLRSVRGDLLERLGRTEEAAAAFTEAAALTANERERELLRARGARAARASDG